MLYLYRRVAFGEQKNADAAAMPDIDAREWLLLAPLAALTLWMGVYPETFMAPMRMPMSPISTRASPGQAQGRRAGHRRSSRGQGGRSARSGEC
jgi:NADH-quinone oxidoreductase subunit M